MTSWQSIMRKVTWRRFDQSAKQLVVGQTTIHRPYFWHVRRPSDIFRHVRRPRDIFSIATRSWPWIIRHSIMLSHVKAFRPWRVSWPTPTQSFKTLRLFVHELRVITVPVDYHRKCVRGHCACAEWRDPWVGVKTITFLESPTPICLVNTQLLLGYDDD